jgi:hypothetical protein
MIELKDLSMRNLRSTSELYCSLCVSYISTVRTVRTVSTVHAVCKVRTYLTIVS